MGRVSFRSQCRGRKTAPSLLFLFWEENKLTKENALCLLRLGLLLAAAAAQSCHSSRKRPENFQSEQVDFECFFFRCFLVWTDELLLVSRSGICCEHRWETEKGEELPMCCWFAADCAWVTAPRDGRVARRRQLCVPSRSITQGRPGKIALRFGKLLSN